MTQATEFFVLGAAVAAVAYTLARTKVSEPWRKWIKAKNEWLGNLFGCPYCLSHWLSFGAVGIYQIRLVEQFYPLDLLVTAMAMVAYAAVIIGTIQVALTR